MTRLVTPSLRALAKQSILFSLHLIEGRTHQDAKAPRRIELSSLSSWRLGVLVCSFFSPWGVAQTWKRWIASQGLAMTGYGTVFKPQANTAGEGLFHA